MTPDAWARLRDLTAARIALGRAGHSLPTQELLSFQLAHAKARDAIWDSLSVQASESILLKTQASDRATYLRRPDLGRRLNPDSAEKLSPGNWDAVTILVDGLSAKAINRYGAIVAAALALELEGWKMAPLCIVEQGRVAIGDEIGQLLGADSAVVLIGERPGLSSPDSLGAYLTWKPQVGRTDAERNCVSNIRTEGLDPAIAVRRIASLLRAARGQQISGVNLKNTGLLE